MADWRPIESAPKDGDVLLWDGRAEIGIWSPISKRWMRLDGWPLEPTHWMPLPAPPERDDG